MHLSFSFLFRSTAVVKLSSRLWKNNDLLAMRMGSECAEDTRKDGGHDFFCILRCYLKRRISFRSGCQIQVRH